MIDSHNHTLFSEDCTSTLDDMILSAIHKGIRYYTITDHLDLDYQDKRFTFNLDHITRKQAIMQAKIKYKDHINIYYGLECGVQPHIIFDAEAIIKRENFDFVIASMHTTHKHDLYTQAFYVNLTPLEAYRAYLKEFTHCLETMESYCVVGHLDVVKRYHLALCEVSLADIKADVITLLAVIIRKGKGIEINTSGYNDCFNHAFPHPTILQWYYDLGGRIITIGSDAHFPEKIGQHYQDALQCIQACGFKHIMYYENMVPIAIPIENVLANLTKSNF